MVFVLSCFSQSNLGTWRLIYRNAISEAPDTSRSFPYVFASGRGFPTGSNLEIASNVFFVTDLAGLLAQRKNAEQVYQYFLAKKYESFGKEFAKRIGPAWWAMITSNSEQELIWQKAFLDSRVDSYSPVYNLSPERKEMSLKMSGINIKLLTGDTVVLDETF